MFGASEDMHVEHLQNNALEFVFTGCSAASQPVEIFLRPGFGTRFYPPAVTFFASAMMIVGPAFIMLFSNFMHMIPLLNMPAPIGMFSLGDFAKVYFLASMIHGVRLWRRMIHMELEQHSEYEGPALPFFQILPKGKSFWFVRIVLEPAFVFVISIVLADLYIAQTDLVLYLRFAALALLTKNFISWFRAWEYLRRLLDLHITGPLIAKLVSGEASEEELATIHLASFPKNIPPDIRKAAIAHVARTYSADNPNF